MSECNHNCKNCSQNCSERTEKPTFELPNEKSRIGRVFAVVGGKGGVGKSLITSLLAVLSDRRGYRTAILDADITGPSIPKSFGIKERAEANDDGILPAVSKTGIKIMSLNLLTENETDPVVWRGALVSGVVKQFWKDVVWGDTDCMFIDMPPGTGDIPLTVFQTIPVDGIIIVATPQELVGMIVKKAVNMAKMMNIPVLGLIENMSYIICPDCQKKIYVFGKSRLEENAKELGITRTARLPLLPRLASSVDEGLIELFDTDALDDFFDGLIKPDEK